MKYIINEYNIRDCRGKQRTKNHKNTCEHLHTLKEYAEKVDIVTEIGTGLGHTTIAFLMGKPKKMTTYDINPGIEVNKIKQAMKGITEFKSIKDNSLDIVMENTDLLFIDSLHEYAHLMKELKLHHSKVKKYMMFHDTETFGRSDQRNTGPGLLTAIEDFLKIHPEWVIHDHIEYQHGLTILKKVE